MYIQIHTYMHTYVHAYVHTYVHTPVPTVTPAPRPPPEPDARIQTRRSSLWASSIVPTHQHPCACMWCRQWYPSRGRHRVGRRPEGQHYAAAAPPQMYVYQAGAVRCLLLDTTCTTPFGAAGGSDSLGALPLPSCMCGCICVKVYVWM